MLRSAGFAIVLGTTACSQVFGLESPTRSVADASVSDIADAPDVLPAWGRPVPIQLSVGDGKLDDPSLTADLLEMYAGLTLGGANAEDIIVGRRATTMDAWVLGTVQALNSGGLDTSAHVTADGLGIYFASDRQGNLDLYFSSRSSRTAPWSPPVRIGEVSTVSAENGASVDPAQRRLVWCVAGPQGDEAIFASERATTSDPWGAPTYIAALDAPGADDCDPMEVGSSTMYFASYRNNAAGADIFVATRSSAAATYGTPTLVDEVSDPIAHDRDPWVSPDHRVLVFASDRDGFERLYISTR